MMHRGKNILILLLAISFQQCSYSQTESGNAKKMTMDSTKNNNPVYSNSDTSQVNMSEEEWKKILPADVCYIARQKRNRASLDQQV